MADPGKNFWVLVLHKPLSSIINYHPIQGPGLILVLLSTGLLTSLKEFDGVE